MHQNPCFWENCLFWVEKYPAHMYKTTDFSYDINSYYYMSSYIDSIIGWFKRYIFILSYIDTLYFHTIIYSYDFWFIQYRFIRRTFHTTLHKSTKVLIHDLHVKIRRTVWFGLIYCSHLELHKIRQTVWFRVQISSCLHHRYILYYNYLVVGVIWSSQLELLTPSVGTLLY